METQFLPPRLHGWELMASRIYIPGSTSHNQLQYHYCKLDARQPRPPPVRLRSELAL